MGATWWQKFWRWIVVLQIIIAVVGVVIGVTLTPRLDWRMAMSWDAGQHALSQAIVADAFKVTGFISFGAMFFSVPIWILVEIHGWWRERRERAEWHSLGRVDPEWQQGRNRARR